VRSPYAVRRPVENPFLVRERDRRLFSELLTVVGAVLLVGLCLWAYTWLNIETSHRGAQVNQLDAELRVLLEQERRLAIDVALKTHPRKIEERAREELAMHSPSFAQTLFYEELVP
jgi:cell division protein FtsB